MTHFGVDLPDALAEQLTRIASEIRSTPEALLRQAAAALVADRKALGESIARGLADVEAGRTAAHEEVMAELDAWVASLEARQRP